MKNKLYELLSNGQVEEAQKLCMEMGWKEELLAIDRSITHLDNPSEYLKWYEKRDSPDSWTQILNAGPDDRQVESMNQIRDLPDHMSVLDAGCADGTLLFFMFQDAVISRAFGIDANITRIEFANKYALEKGYNAKFAQGLFEDVVIPDTYDVIFMGEILEHVINAHSFVEKALKSIEPNGHFVITVPVESPSASEANLQEQVREHVRHVDHNALEMIFGPYGYVLKKEVIVGQSWKNLVATLGKA